MTILLKQDDLNYFVCNVLPFLEHREEICIHRSDGYKYELNITEEVAEQIVDACLTRLMQVGLNPDHEPNAEGMRLEMLADYFNPAQ
jgi:hypothetical protein